MNERSREFIKKNFSLFHIAGIVLGWIFAFIYWFKMGQFTENILKNNIVLISIWGILIGYITFDLIKNAVKRDQK